MRIKLKDDKILRECILRTVVDGKIIEREYQELLRVIGMTLEKLIAEAK